MNNFNAPKKGNKGVVRTYLIWLAVFLLGAMVAYVADVHFSEKEGKAGATESAETLVAPAIYCTRGRRYLCAMSDDVV